MADWSAQITELENARRTAWHFCDFLCLRGFIGYLDANSEILVPLSLASPVTTPPSFAP